MAAGSSKLELEHKFLIKPGLEVELSNMGAQLVKDEQFSDVYYDVKENTLALNDFWLRKRDSKLQLKYPPKTRTPSSVLQYLECENPDVILDLVRQLLNCQLSDEALFEEVLTPFAEYTTRRRSYHLSDISIDLDQTDFGYEIGEVELLAEVVCDNDIELTEKRLRAVIDTLSTEIVNHSEGKMQSYLSRHNPDLYNRLKATHVL